MGMANFWRFKALDFIRLVLTDGLLSGRRQCRPFHRPLLGAAWRLRLPQLGSRQLPLDVAPRKTKIKYFNFL